MKKIVVTALLAFMVGLAILHDYNNRMSNRIEVPAIDDIASVQILPPQVGGGFGVKPIIFNLSDTIQRLAVAEILMWLKDSKYIGEAKNQLVSGGSSPQSLTLKLINGKKIIIVDAVGAVSTKVANGIAIKSVQIRDQVTIYRGNKAIRIDSPELKEWIEVGWEDYK